MTKETIVSLLFYFLIGIAFGIILTQRYKDYEVDCLYHTITYEHKLNDANQNTIAYEQGLNSNLFNVCGSMAQAHLITNRFTGMIYIDFGPNFIRDWTNLNYYIRVGNNKNTSWSSSNNNKK